MTELSAEALDRWAPPLAQLDPDGDDVFFVEDEDDKEPSESTEARSLRGRLFNVGLVRLPTSSRLHDYDAGELTLRRGDEVVVQSERGQAIGVVVAPSIRVLLPESLSRRILRRATANDHLQRERDQLRAGESVPFVKDRVSARRLPMKLVCVERVQGGNKAIFYFSAEGRVDFRDLVKDLAQNFRSRIEMRQIGVRDEAKMVGGIGICGLRICCHRYLTKFEPVSIRMAKDQNLVLNPQKVSGQCGRLKCCLAYEQEAYREQRKGMPKLGKTVVTPDGEGKVVELDILRRMARVLLAQGGSAVYRADELGPRDAGAHPSHDQDSELGEEGFDGEEGPGAADGTEPTGAHLPHRRGGEERPGASLSHGQ
ncbi:MAG: stage 0 sporulation family protein, partial [Polyangia bacterium]|nr:stage 0 sporulation family protein [Polyangia bacterium]